jgi:hypothetical protein
MDSISVWLVGVDIYLNDQIPMALPINIAFTLISSILIARIVTQWQSYAIGVLSRKIGRARSTRPRGEIAHVHLRDIGGRHDTSE